MFPSVLKVRQSGCVWSRGQWRLWMESITSSLRRCGRCRRAPRNQNRSAYCSHRPPSTLTASNRWNSLPWSQPLLLFSQDPLVLRPRLHSLPGLNKSSTWECIVNVKGIFPCVFVPILSQLRQWKCLCACARECVVVDVCWVGRYEYDLANWQSWAEPLWKSIIAVVEPKCWPLS